jgi:ABC-2 type transport system ATP-binding protein
MVTDGPPPAGGAVVVAALPHDGGMRYRVVAAADTVPPEAAVSVAPTLEDGYLALVGERQVTSRPHAAT